MTMLHEPTARPAGNLRGEAPFQDLHEVVRDRVGDGTFHFYPSPGNWGDSLINRGSREFFQHLGLTCTEHERSDLDTLDPETTAGTTAVVGGGGGWNRNWISTVAFTERVASMYRDVVVLPSSYDLDLLPETGLENAVLFSRAELSGTEKASGSPLRFCHDMAFFCELPEAPDRTLPYPLIALRRDKERHHLAVDPDRNFDISLLGTAHTDAGGFFDIVGRFEELYTDRLHVAIAGAMLGKSVFLLEGNYGKSEGVFRGSLAAHYPNVQLLDWDEFAPMKVVGMQPIGVPGYQGEASHA
ncbi:hypothetical protein AFL01nite_25540 [Aeromicrobium flavum]|uniref:Polysaccharide pyruvyl transferase domain-containing protein n=1 Tax=Aeromicrobium flavum TaxID=416568 RepID=A0A512HXP5_9ACTN|nr:hypothetical protein [Aeromicrobium flavum]GEO90227.1 hypothetical protein AFL01nite_25540 [Aeromicrobium flavum]